VAIRRGQEAGEIRNSGDHEGNQYANGRVHQAESSKPSPADYAKRSELYGSNPGKPGIYDLTDNVSDEDFEAAASEARAEGRGRREHGARF